jgi:hypothetical protein
LISEWQAAFIRGISPLKLSISASKSAVYFYNFSIFCYLLPEVKRDLRVDLPD